MDFIIITFIVFVVPIIGITMFTPSRENEPNTKEIKDWVNLDCYEEETEIVVKVLGPKGTTKKAARRFCRVASDKACKDDMRSELDIHEMLNLNWIEHANPSDEIGYIEIVVNKK